MDPLLGFGPQIIKYAGLSAVHYMEHGTCIDSIISQEAWDLPSNVVWFWLSDREHLVKHVTGKKMYDPDFIP